MALHGKNAKIAGTKNNTTIGKTNSWTITLNNNIIETPLHGHSWMSRLAGIQDWSATIEADRDVGGALQTTLQDGILAATPATVKFRFFVNAASYYEGRGWIDSVDTDFAAEDKGNVTYNVVAQGTLTFN